jgi:radical SAM enzyme (TIGR01210 family)
MTTPRPLSRAAPDPWKPYAFFVEPEMSAAGRVDPVATVFLTNRECPWHCVMCDLWQNTLADTVPAGAIPAQIDYALARMPEARAIKLYNAGSFFDARAIPVSDYTAIATRAGRFDRVIVESHPALIGGRCFEFRDLLPGSLEVAMGLETAHPGALARLNKGMTLDQFAESARRLRENGIDLRAFLLVQPPFVAEEEAADWVARSLTFAFDCGASVASLIPTRVTTGTMTALAEKGEFRPPRMKALEEAVEYGLALKRGRVFADLWDLRLASVCPLCQPARVERLRQMNLSQTILEPVRCDLCSI